MIPKQCIEVQTSPLERPRDPPWFAEVAILSRHLATKGLLEALTQQVRLVRGHFGHYEPLDFLALLIGYAISGERTLADFFERLSPFGAAFMALDAACQPSPPLESEPLPSLGGSPLLGNLSYAFRAVQLSRRMDQGFYRWHFRSTRTPLQCL